MSNEVIRYYDSNTARFLKYGQGAGNNAIHRAVWADGIETRQQAMNYVNSRIADGILGASTGGHSLEKRVLDIGCGVGGSMLYLAGVTSVHLSGVTISPRQVEVGRHLIEAAGLSQRCSMISGDFTDPELAARLSPPYNAAYAIESFLHMPDAEQFFAQAGRLLQAGGKLYICDDFLSTGSQEIDENRAGRRRRLFRRLLQRFQRGWQVKSLYTVSYLQSLAEKHGFTLAQTENLTPFLELNRPRDIGIRVLVGLFGWLPIHSPFWHNLLGGDSLQRLLLRGDLQYYLLQFEKNVSLT